MLDVKKVPLTDTFQFAGAFSTPATADLKVVWEAVERPEKRGLGDSVDPTDPGAFRGRFAQARARAWINGRELGFGFRSKRGASSDLGFAEFGMERNGVFL